VIAPNDPAGGGTIAASPPPPSGGDRSSGHISTIASGGMLNFLGAVVAAVLNFALVTIITRGLGAEIAGAFFVALALFSLLTNTLELGADTGMVRTVAAALALRRHRELRKIIAVAVVPVLVGGTVAAIVVYVFADPFARVFSGGAEGPVADLVRVFAFFLPFASAYTVVVAGTRGFGTMVPSFLIDRTAKPAVQVVVTLLVVWIGWETAALAVAWSAPIAIGFGAAMVVIFALQRRVTNSALPPLAEPRSTMRVASEFWRFTAPRGLAGMFQVAIVWTSTLMVGALRSTSEAGIYAAATRYLLVGTFATVAISQVFGPKMSQLSALEDHESALTVYRVTTSWYLVLTWPLYWTMIVFAPALVSIFGREFLPGADPLVILGVTMLIATACGPVDVVLLMAGKSSWNLVNTLIALVLNLGLSFLLIPSLGISGAAIAWSASILANNLLPLAQTWRFLHLDPFGRGFPRAALAATATFAAVGIVVRLLLGPTLLALVASSFIATAAYAWLLWRSRDALNGRVVLDALRQRRDRPERPASASNASLDA
jgi:O-antigen/teichoic acid export membrane protein